MDDVDQNQGTPEMILGKFKDTDALAEAYKNLEKSMGNRVKVPDFVNGSEEEVSKFYSKVRPADKGAYELDGVEDADSLRDLAYRNGFNTSQAKAVAEYLAGKRLIDGRYFTVENSTELAKETFGDRAPEVAEKATKVLDAVLSEEERAQVNDLDNRATMTLYKAIDKLYKVTEEGKIESPYSMNPGAAHKGAPDYKGFNEEYGKMKSRPHSQAEVDALKAKFNLS